MRLIFLKNWCTGTGQQICRAITSTGGLTKIWRNFFLRCSQSTKFDENWIGDQFFFLSIKMNEENNLYPTLRRGVFRRCRGRDLKNFFWGKALQTPVSSPSLCMFHGYGLLTTLSPFNMMLIKVAQNTFYMTCALAFTRFLVSQKWENVRHCG